MWAALTELPSNTASIAYLFKDSHEERGGGIGEEIIRRPMYDS
jgi:hypothetical protein